MAGEPMVSETRDAGFRLPLSVRSHEPELLDLGVVSGTELRTNLADLARLNRLPGGSRASVAAIGRLVGGRRDAEILDVGTGGGDLPLAFAARGWQVTGLDADPAVADDARARTARQPRIRILEGDASALPMADGSVDVAHASLLLHHLDADLAVRVLGEMRRVARHGIVINDLRRGVLPLLATGVAIAALARCRTTRHDGLLSVRRAYTLAELDAMLAAAGLRVVTRTTPWLPRVVTTAVRRMTT